MTLLRYLLIFTGIGLLAGAMTILVWDLYQIFKWRKNIRRGNHNPALRWYTSRRLAMLCVLPLLAGLSIAVVPSGWAGVRVNQFLGTRPGTLYPGVHLILPLIEEVELYPTRDSVFSYVRRGRSQEKAGGAAGADARRSAVGLAVVGALSPGSVEARLHSLESAATAGGRDDRAGDRKHIS